jgi:hypothetical protein
MRSKYAIAALATSALACAYGWPLEAFAEASVAAADVVPRVDVVPTAAAKEAANELMRLQEETLILKAELKKLDAQAQVAEREATLHRMGGTELSFSDVSLVATQSLGKRISATMSTSDGAEFDAVTGETLPNGMRVAAIRPGAVVLVSPGGRRTTLPVSISVRDPARNVTQAGMGGVPPIPAQPTLGR